MSPDVKEWLSQGATVTAVVVGLTGAFFALQNYRHQTRTKKAEFLLSLHKSFFVEDFYKEIRDKIDCGTGEEIDVLIQEQPSGFTDFLNFFEMVAYMKKEKILSIGDVHALLGYYFQALRRNPALLVYIADPKNGFEHLDDLMKCREDFP